MLSLWCHMAKRHISHAFCLLYLIFPTKQLHMKLCDWLNSVEVTSSSHFYLSARRSWLTTFLRDRSTETVSTSLSISHLARRAVQSGLLNWHPHPSKCVVQWATSPFRVLPSGACAVISSALGACPAPPLGCHPILSLSSPRFSCPGFVVFLVNSLSRSGL